MAVAAANVALVDLRSDRRGAAAVAHQTHDAVTLAGAGTMIEVEQAKIAGTAIHTRMRLQVRGDKRAAFRALREGTGTDGDEVTFAIRPVVAA